MTKNTYTLLAIETAHIQSYIFGSNRLKENVGASYLVAAATGHWALETIRSLTDAHNLLANDDYDSQRQIEHDSEQLIEVLYSGGGNFVALFAEPNDCKAFCRDLSRRVIVEAPGLQIVFHAKPYKWDEEAISVAVSQLLFELKAQRAYQIQGRGMGGLGVTAACSSTNFAAVALVAEDDSYQLYSAEALSKHEAAVQANTLLQNQLSLRNDYSFALDIDKLGGTKGQRSTIAVVHADGNGLGVLIQGLQEQFPKPRDNRDYINYMRGFSENVKAVNRLAQEAMILQLLQSIEENERGERRIVGLHNQAPITLERENGQYIFPLRPLVSGGDDISFVCDGRIAIDLAATFLQAFEYYTEKILKMRLTACAGIAIVKAHYPFARAYDLADELTSSAKQLANRKEYKHNGLPRYSVLDWHFTNGGLYGDLELMREREYQMVNGNLNLRPIFLVEDAHPYRNWSEIQRLITKFQRDWSESRSKAKALMKALREGAIETQIYELRYLKNNGLALPAFAGFEAKHGWDNDVCAYYDALELMDLYIPLSKLEKAAQ